MGIVSQKLRDSARGQECTLRFSHICQGGTESVVLCHLPSRIGLKGTGMKVPDWWACFGCHACHNVLDLRQHALEPARVDWTILAAVQRTWAVWFEMGLLRVAGDSDKPRTKPVTDKIVPRKPSWSLRPHLTPIGSLDRPGHESDGD